MPQFSLKIRRYMYLASLARASDHVWSMVPPE